MDQKRLEELAGHVQRLRQEAEALARETSSFPAIWRNASKALASIRMMELTLGLEASTIVASTMAASTMAASTMADKSA